MYLLGVSFINIFLSSCRCCSSLSRLNCVLVFLLLSIFSIFLPISSISELSSSELSPSSVLSTSLDDSTRFCRSKMRWHSSLYLSWCSAIENRLPRENFVIPSSPAFAFSVERVRTTSMTSQRDSFLMSSSGTPNFRSRAFALFRERRRRSASVPVTVRFGCASCSSCVIIIHKYFICIPNYTLNIKQNEEKRLITLLTVGLFGTLTYEKPSPHPVGSAGPANCRRHLPFIAWM